VIIYNLVTNIYRKILRIYWSIFIPIHLKFLGATIYAHKKVIIGEQCLIGADVKIFDTNFHSLKSENRGYNKEENDISSKKVVIGDNCFIGTNAIILKGCNLKKDTIIPAGSIIK